jgi:hypothetical protein
MEDYAGFEPQIGEIRALRTFRVGPDGGLYPLYSDTAWVDGVNTAQCKLASAGTRERIDRGRHATPDPDCTCGYYAYASESGAAERPHARYVLAVVACWGKVIAGTRGIRAEQARVEALWMSAIVPRELAESVAARYPSATLYAEKDAMLAEHPPTALDCYEPDEPARDVRTSRVMRLAIAAAVVIGALPASWIWQQPYVRALWAAEVCLFVIAAVMVRRTRRDVRAPATALLYAGLAVWLLAPFAGSAGLVLLRLPLVQITTLGLLQRHHLNREARRFPARIARRQW